MDASVEEKTFLEAILADPTNRTARVVFADWLDERGQAETAYAIRWMVRHRREPCFVRGMWEWYWDLSRLWDSDPSKRRRAPVVSVMPSWLPEFVGRVMDRRWGSRSRTWLVAVKRLGWALARIREIV